jgi:hypothetical protein
MSLNVRSLKETDFDNILSEWWTDWGFEPVPKEFLPDDGKGGIMICDGDTPVCAGFIYMTNSKIAWVDWIVSNKKYRKKPFRNQSIRMVINILTNIAKDSGFRYCYSLMDNEKLVDIFKELGYVSGIKYKQEMIKTLY